MYSSGGQHTQQDADKYVSHLISSALIIDNRAHGDRVPQPTDNKQKRTHRQRDRTHYLQPIETSNTDTIKIPCAVSSADSVHYRHRDNVTPKNNKKWTK